MATTQEGWEHHGRGFVAQDVQMALEDYADASTVIAYRDLRKGRTEIGRCFEGLFVECPRGGTFNLPTCVVLGKNVYIAWNAESDSVVCEFATDTFTIEAGEITIQRIGYVKRSKSPR